MSRSIYGIHPVREFLDATPDKASKLYIKKHNKGALKELCDLARQNAIQIKFANSQELDNIGKNGNHQGVLLKVEDFSYTNLDDWFDKTDLSEKPHSVIILDQIKDPHNLGAILRTAECFGASGVILPKDNSVGVTETVVRVSAGAADLVPIIQVVNINRTIEKLKEYGFWVVGTLADADTSIYKADLKTNIAFVLGNEGQGMRKLTRKACDFHVSLPKEGKIDSLNVSVCAGVILAEAYRQRTN